MPPLVRTGAGFCLLLVLLALGLKAAGASWINVAFAVTPLAVAFLYVAAEPRLHRLTRPKPKLTLVLEGASDGRLVSAGLPPWPLHIERIVANEAADALDTVRDPKALPSWLTMGIGLAARPTPEDHQRAKERFESEVETYKEELREWLNEYSRAAIARWETFEVSLALSNATGAAHAEAVEVVLELPETVGRGSAGVQVEAPPTRPTYRPPQPRSLLDWGRPSPFVAARPQFDLDDFVPSPRSKQEWDESSTSRRLTAPRIDVQPGRTIEVAEPLWLRAHGPGVHEVQWSVYSQSLDHPVRGSFKLVIPQGDSERPPFGRMEGILRFPDAPIVREHDGDEAAAENDESRPTVRPVRNSDPPLAPPSSDAERDDGDVLAKIQEASRHWEWEALGLDPELDRPGVSRRVEVRKADQRSPEG